MEILLMPCITFRLKDDGSSAGRGFQNTMYDQIFCSAFIIENKCSFLELKIEKLEGFERLQSCCDLR
jgi:hypothetical protein